VYLIAELRSAKVITRPALEGMRDYLISGNYDPLILPYPLNAIHNVGLIEKSQIIKKYTVKLKVTGV
jgi:hypothetical protein